LLEELAQSLLILYEEENGEQWELMLTREVNGYHINQRHQITEQELGDFNFQ